MPVIELILEPARADAAADAHGLRAAVGRRRRSSARSPRAGSTAGATTLISLLAVLAYATPVFWLGLMLIVVFSIRLGWLPTSGMEHGRRGPRRLGRAFGDIARHLVLPAVTLALFYLALYARLMRASVLEQFAHGLRDDGARQGPDRARRSRAATSCATPLLPVVTMAGVQVGELLGGSVVVETVFGWPGLGLLAYDALFARDINLLLGIFFVSAVPGGRRQPRGRPRLLAARSAHRAR